MCMEKRKRISKFHSRTLLGLFGRNSYNDEVQIRKLHSSDVLRLSKAFQQIYDGCSDATTALSDSFIQEGPNIFEQLLLLTLLHKNSFQEGLMPRSKSQDNLYRTMQAYVRMDPSYTPDIGHLVFPNREEREREYQRARSGRSVAANTDTKSQPATPSKPRYRISDIFSRRNSKDKQLQQQQSYDQSMDEQQWRSGFGGSRFRTGARADSVQSGMMPTRTGRGRIGASASMDRGVSRYKAGEAALVGGGVAGHAPWFQAWHGASSSDQPAYARAMQRQQSATSSRQYQRSSQPSSRRVSPNRIFDLTTAAPAAAVSAKNAAAATAARESNISVVQIRNSPDPHDIPQHATTNASTRSFHGSRSNTSSGGRNIGTVPPVQNLTKHQSLGSTSYGYAMQLFARESLSSGYDSADKPGPSVSNKQPWSPLPQDNVHPTWLHSHHQFSLDESNRRVKCAHIDAIGASRTGSRLADHGYVNETHANRRIQRQMTDVPQPSSYLASQEIPMKKESPRQSPKKFEPPSIPTRFEEPTIPQTSKKIATSTTIVPPSAISPRLMHLGLPALFSPPPITPILSPPPDFQDKDTTQPTKSSKQTFFRRSPLLSRSDAIRDSDGSPPATPPPNVNKAPTLLPPDTVEPKQQKSPSPVKEQQKQLQQQLQKQKLQQQLQHQILQNQIQEQEKTYRMTQTRSLEDTSASRRIQFIQKHGESSSSSSQSTQQLTTQAAAFRSLDSCMSRGGMPRLSEMTTDSSMEVREDDADDEGNNSSSVNTIVRPQSRERISPSSRNNRIPYRVQTRRSPGSSDNRASNCNSRDVSSSSDEDVLACSRSPSGTLSNTRRGAPAVPQRQGGATEDIYVRKTVPPEESGYVRRSCSLQLPDIPASFLGRLSPQQGYKEVPSKPGSKRTSRCTTPQQQSIDFDMKREVAVVTEFVGASRCSAAAKSLLEDRIPNTGNVAFNRGNGYNVNTAGRTAPQVPPRNCSLNKQQSQHIDTSQTSVPIYDTLDFNYLAQQQHEQQQRYNKQQQLLQQQWKQELGRPSDLFSRSRSRQRASPSPTKTLEAPVPTFRQRLLNPNTKSASADQHVTMPRRSPIPITRSLNPSNSSSNSDVFLAASVTNSPRKPASESSGSNTPILDYCEIQVPKDYETVSFGDFGRESIATRPGSAQSAITHQQHQEYQQRRGRAPAGALVQMHQERSMSLPRTLSTIGDEGSVSDKTLTPTWTPGDTESQRSSPRGRHRRRYFPPSQVEAASVVQTAPVSPQHDMYGRRTISPSGHMDVGSRTSPKCQSTPSQLDIPIGSQPWDTSLYQGRDPPRDPPSRPHSQQSRSQSRDNSRNQSPDNTLGKKGSLSTETKPSPSRLEDAKARSTVAPAAKGGLLSSIKRGFGSLGSRVGRSSASIDLGMSMPSQDGAHLTTGTSDPIRQRLYPPKHQMSLDATGRDAPSRAFVGGRPGEPPRTLSLNAGPFKAQQQSLHQNIIDKPEAKQRFSAFGIGFMRSSKDKKKLNKSERNKKCNSSDSGIQIDTSGGEYIDASGFHLEDTLAPNHNITSYFQSSTVKHFAIDAPTSRRTTDVATSESERISQLQREPQDYDQYSGQYPEQSELVNGESDHYRNNGYSEGGYDQGGKSSPKLTDGGGGYEETVDGQNRSRSQSRVYRTQKSDTLRPEKLRRIKASILSSPYHTLSAPLSRHRHPAVRRAYSDLSHQHLEKLRYMNHQPRITATKWYISSPISTPDMSGSPVPESDKRSNYITRVAINVEVCDEVNSAVNGRVLDDAEDTVQLRRGSCVAWRNKDNRVGGLHPLRRSLSQPLDADRLKEVLTLVKGKRALRLHRAQVSTSNHQRNSSDGTTTPNTTPNGTTSTSAATSSDDSDYDDDSVASAERMHQSLRQRRASLEELSNLKKESLRGNGSHVAEEDQVVVLAEAVFDYVAIERDELAFKAGEVIEIHKTSDRNWWWGSAGGNSGWFPADRVRLRVSQEDTFEDCIAALQSGNVAPTPLRRRTSISLLSNDQVRTSIVRELIHTERDFVKVLLDVSEGYMAECRKRTEMFTPCQIDTVFLNIEEILRFQTTFLKDLEQCLDWDAPYKSCVGECFLKHRKGFTIYSHYCNGHTLAAATLQELCQLNNYSKFFEACRLMRGLIEIPLHGYLLAPVQRICKYPLQLAELLKYTRAGHKDHLHVQQALAAMRDVATLINDRKRRMESLEKLQIWQQRVEGWQGADVIDESTQMIYQGETKRISAKRLTSNIMLFLFDYQVIYCKKDILNKNTYTYKGRISMDTTEVINLDDGKNPDVHMNVRNAIKLESYVSDWFLLFGCRTRLDKQRWLDAFKSERQLVEADRAAHLDVDFLPAARHLAKVAFRCQSAADSQPKKPIDKHLGNESYRSNMQLTQHSNSNSLGRRMGMWLTFGGTTKRKRYRPRNTD